MAAVAEQSRCLRAAPWHPEPPAGLLVSTARPGQAATNTHLVALPAELQAGTAAGRSLMHVSPATAHPHQTSAQTKHPPALSLLKENPKHLRISSPFASLKAQFFSSPAQAGPSTTTVPTARFHSTMPA